MENEWASLVRDFADAEQSQHDIPTYKSRFLARDILYWIRNTRIRQYNLFTQQRGEEFERFKAMMAEEYSEGAVQRFLDEEDLWTATLRMAEQ